MFFAPGTNESLRISGTAELHADDEKLEQMRARGKAALLTTRVTISEVFFHCGKALIRSELWTSNQSVAHHKVSFGQAYVERQKQSGLLAKTTGWAIDRLIRKDYRIICRRGSGGVIFSTRCLWSRTAAKHAVSQLLTTFGIFRSDIMTRQSFWG